MLDGLRAVIPSPDSARGASLVVSVTTFFMPRESPFSRKEVAAPAALTALAGSIRRVCRRHS